MDAQMLEGTLRHSEGFEGKPDDLPSFAPHNRAADVESMTLEVGLYSLCGPRHANEDRLSVWPDLRSCFGEAPTLPCRTTLLLLSDGHSGSACADYIQQQFVTHLQRVMQRQAAAAAKREAGHTSATSVHTQDQQGTTPRRKNVKAVDWPAALRAAFLAVESSWTERTLAEVTSSQTVLARHSAGACLTIVIIAGPDVHVANVGDSKVAIRTSSGLLKDCTEDHRCCNPNEMARIAAAGGHIVNGRIAGILEPTRTIGDLTVKAKCKLGVVSAEPWVSSCTLSSTHVSTAVEVGASISALQTSMAATPMTAPHRSQLHPFGRRGAITGALCGLSQLNLDDSSLSSAEGVPGYIQARGESEDAACITDRSLLTPTPRSRTTPFTRYAASTVEDERSACSSPVPTTLQSPFSLSDAMSTSASLSTSVLVLASDGVWDVLSSEEATAIVVYALAVHGDPAAAARELCSMALQEGSRDDITVAVVQLLRDLPSTAIARSRPTASPCTTAGFADKRQKARDMSPDSDDTVL